MDICCIQTKLLCLVSLFPLFLVCQPGSQPCHVLSVIIRLRIQDIVLDTASYFVYGAVDLLSLMYRVCAQGRDMYVLDAGSLIFENLDHATSVN